MTISSLFFALIVGAQLTTEAFYISPTISATTRASSTSSRLYYEPKWKKKETLADQGNDGSFIEKKA